MFLVVALNQEVALNQGDCCVMVNWHKEDPMYDWFPESGLPDIRLLPLRVGIYLDIAREHLRPGTPSGSPLTAACQRVLIRPNEAFVRMWHKAFADTGTEEVDYATLSCSDDPDWSDGFSGPTFL